MMRFFLILFPVLTGLYLIFSNIPSEIKFNYHPLITLSIVILVMTGTVIYGMRSNPATDGKKSGSNSITVYSKKFFNLIKSFKNLLLWIIIPLLAVYGYLVYENGGDFRKPIDEVIDFLEWKEVASVTVNARELAEGNWCYTLNNSEETKVVTRPNYKMRFIISKNRNGSFHSSEIYTVKSDEGLRYPSSAPVRRSDLQSIEKRYDSNIAGLAEIRSGFTVINTKSGWKPTNMNVGVNANVIKESSNICVGMALSEDFSSHSLYKDGLVTVKLYQK